MKKVSTKQRLLSVLLSVVLVMTSIQFNGITAKADDTNQNTTKVVTDWSKVEISDANVTSVSDVVTEIIFTESVTSVNLSTLDTTKLRGITFRNPDTEVNIDNNINLANVRIWCTYGSKAEAWAHGRGLTIQYLNNDALVIDYGAASDLVRYTGSGKFKIKSTTGADIPADTTTWGIPYSDDIIWSTSDSDVIDFVVDGDEYSTVDSRWLLDKSNTAPNVERKDNNKSDITVELNVKKKGTATITAESRSGKTATIIYTVRQATSSIKINVKVYKPVTQLNDKNQVITDVEGITLAGDTRPTSCRVKLQEAASKEFTFESLAQGIDELKLDEGSYFTVSYTIDDACEDYIRTSLSQTNNVIEGGTETVGANTTGYVGLPVAGYLLNGVEIPMDNMYYANAATLDVTKPFNLKGISMNNATQRLMNVYVCKPCENLTVKMDKSTVANGAGIEKKRTDDMLMEASIGNSTDIVSWRIVGTVGIASIGSPDKTTTNIHINSIGDFTIVCETKDFKTGDVNASSTITIVATECYAYDGLGFSNSAKDKLVTEYRFPTNYKPVTGEESKKVYITNVKDGVIFTDYNPNEAPNETLIYTSSEPNILSIDSTTGTITTGANTGTVTVTVYPKDRRDAEVSIPVIVYAPLTSFNTESTTVEVPAGQYRDVPVRVTPDNSEEPIIWLSKNSSYVEAEEYFDPTTKLRYLRLTGIKPSESLADKYIEVEGKTETSGKSSTLKVVVLEPVHADVVSVTNADKKAEITTDENGNILIRIAKGQKATLLPNLTSTTGAKVNDMVKWGLEADTNVISGTVVGNNLELTGKSAGDSSITLKAYGGDSEKTIECKVQVYVPATKLDIMTNGTAADTTKLEVGTTLANVYANFTPSDSTDEVTWTVKEEGIISLSKTTTNSKDKSIAISALKTGRAHLVATTTSGISDEVEVNVIKTADSIEFTRNDEVVKAKTYINLGATENIGIKITGEGTTDNSCTWQVPNDTGILTVNPAEGGLSATVTGLAPGTQTVAVTAPSGKTANITIVVVQPATSIELNATELTVVKGDQPLNVYATLGPNTTTDQVTWSVPEAEEGIISWTEMTGSSVTNTQKHITVSAVKAGTAHLTATTVSGKTATIVVTSVARDMNTDDTTVNVTDVVYTGAELKPTVNVMYKNVQLRDGTDYSLEYSNNVNVGTGTVTITGIGNYAGVKSVNFNITERTINSAQIKQIASVKYTGAEIKPEIVVVDNGTGTEVTLKKDVDYSVEYSNNINKGTAIVKINGLGNYKDSKTANFVIEAKSLASEGITVSDIKTVTYNYTSQMPEVTVKDGNKQLKAGENYSVRYENNVNAGIATVTITGAGNYADSVVKTFKINKKSLSSAKVTGLQNVVYTGKSITQNINVNINNRTLSLGTDYTIKYSSNKNPGRATVKITGKGNFTGSKTVYFIIYPKVPKSPKMSSTSTSSLKLTWSKSSGASGYIISVFNSKKNKYVKVATSTKNYVTIKKLSAGTTYQYSISPYVKVGSKIYASSEFVTVNAGTSVAPTKIKKISAGVQNCTVTYSASKNADGYAIYTSTKKSGKYKLVTTTTGVSAYLSGLKSKKTIYVKVRSYKNINGKTYYAAYSAAKAVKIK